MDGVAFPQEFRVPHHLNDGLARPGEIARHLLEFGCRPRRHRGLPDDDMVPSHVRHQSPHRRVELRQVIGAVRPAGCGHTDEVHGGELRRGSEVGGELEPSGLDRLR